MDIERMIKESRQQVSPDEKKIRQTVMQSKRALLKAEAAGSLSWVEFFVSQGKMIRKRWWLLQVLVLCLSWQILSSETDMFYAHRSLGVFAGLFVILLIPEFWKNVTWRCMEIEITSYYSLRQIYAARLIWFGGVDIFLLTVFGVGACSQIGITRETLIADFLLPLVITACICFAVLEHRHRNALTATGMCIGWCAAWLGVITSEPVYEAISKPVWMAVFAAACLCFVIIISRLVKNMDLAMEGRQNGTVFE